jgi:PhnB protein
MEAGMATVKAVPEGLHTITPQLTVEGAAEAIELYKKAFGAEEISRALDPSGKKVWHCDLRIGNSAFFINDAMPEMGGPAHGTDLWVYTEKADELFKRAADAGLKVVMPMTDQFWGDRTCTLQDRWGNKWMLARRVKELTPEQMKKAGEEFAKNYKP